MRRCAAPTDRPAPAAPHPGLYIRTPPAGFAQCLGSFHRGQSSSRSNDPPPPSDRRVHMASLSLLLLSMSMSALVLAVMGVPEESPSDKAMRLKVPIPKLFAADEDGRVGGECTIEVPTTQKVTGECLKLGRFARGCVAGAYLEAYHQDCI